MSEPFHYRFRSDSMCFILLENRVTSKDDCSFRHLTRFRLGSTLKLYGGGRKKEKEGKLRERLGGSAKDHLELTLAAVGW